jgi:triacylglycerol esterase/lipase EstA (alpha/beta hydrolase family)
MWSAISLWAFNLAALVLYALLAHRAVAAGGSVAAWVVGVPLLYFGAILALCACYFVIAWVWRARRPPSVRIGWRRTLRLLWREYATLAGAPIRMMLYARLMRDPAPARVELPVLLVHGVLCNAGVWARLARFLRDKQVTGVYSVSYGPPLASIELFAEQLARKIDEVLAATGSRRVIVIAHSMGGLVVRAYLRKFGSARIARVMSIGAPHHGSMHAWFFPGGSLAQLRPGNAWLEALNAEPLDPSLRFLSLWSWHDSMVAPQTSSELPGSIDATLVGVGHNALLTDPHVFARVLAEIRDARATSGSPA